MKRIAMALCAVFSAAAWAGLAEFASMRDLPSHFDRETLLIFDLDNTLIEPAQTLGSDQWFNAQVQLDRAAGVPLARSIDKWSPTAMALHRLTQVKLVEPETADIVWQAQRAGTPVMGLTARWREIADTSTRQLGSVGVNLGLHPPYAGGWSQGGNRYVRGILFVEQGGDKGVSLLKFLDARKLRPKKIVFIDDKAHNVESVVKALESRGIAHEGLRYGAADARVKAYDADLAACELKLYRSAGVLLPDAVARQRCAP